MGKQKMKNSIILGRGYVGKATAYALGIKDYYSRSKSTVDINHILDFKYIFICLPTPTVDGKQDLTIIEHYLKLFSERAKDNIFIIRSTILPETCRKLTKKYNLKIVHVPEFLTEKTWKQDAEWPDLVVVGADDRELGNEIMGIFKARYKGANFFQVDTVTSETIKYAVNTFYSTKVLFANQLFDLCDKIGVNYETIKKALYSRKWIGKNHLDIWHKGGRGCGGSCLAKDVEAFSNFSNSPLLKLVNELNRELLKKYPKDETEKGT